MQFNQDKYEVKELTLDQETIRYRVFADLVYVEKPINSQFQKMNIYVPEVYYEGETINGYTLESAPVFMPNAVGGYMPGEVEEPGYKKFGPKTLNSLFRALQHGYVVASPGIRGRVQKNEEGIYTGKAPACIVDYKAAVRYLHYFADELPGDENKIITNGTSAGGALSSLMGATGNHPDYAPYLEELGAADAGDEIFAASCYCPITNLDHADMAYEWEFNGVNDFHRMNMAMDEGGRPAFTPIDGRMTEKQIRVSDEEAKLFPAYLNSLELRDEDGNALTLDENGEGSFKDYIKKVVLASAQRAIERGRDVSEKKWLTVTDGKAVAMDFDAYVRDITRMKTAPAFDALNLDSPENNLFGTESIDCCYFTEYSYASREVDGVMAEAEIVKLLNPMYYIEDARADTVKYWRIRHGECDRDTSLAISAMLTAKLRSQGCEVDYHSPWDTPHSGDYDLDELFTWIDKICK